MVFDSYTFLIFLAATLPAYYVLPWQNAKLALLLAGSLYFYGAWNPPFTALLVAVSAIAWLAAEGLDRSSSRFVRRAWLVTGVTLILAPLVFFKYGTFLWNNARAVGEATAWYALPAAAPITLPVGISFFTFQAMSYTCDVYLRRHERSRSFFDFLLYIAFFPQLVAGPIVRFHEFAPQLLTPKPFEASAFLAGLKLLILGMFQKVVIADGICAGIADNVFDGTPHPSTVAAWIGTLAFAVQIFCDFAGYSTAAIGTAALYGYHLPMNFNAPYGAVGFSDFWRRWHITLSSWLRDYVYIPLGGSRGGPVATARNLMVTMLLGGLWHGAAWTFVVWGGLHGALLVGQRCAARYTLTEARGWFGHVMSLLTFAMICLTWVPFRARSFDSMRSMIVAMIGFGGPGGVALSSAVPVLLLAVGTVVWHRFHATGYVIPWAKLVPGWVEGLGYGVLAFALFTAQSENRAFIYFQF
jgi:alginate O-acetyltransferase complex protein AlgI